MKLKYLFLLISIGLFSSCEENTITLDENNLLLGNWVAPVYDGETTTFTRSSKLPDEGYGVAFYQNGDFRERSSGFCGTPPLSFFNIDGYFNLENTLINITKDGYPAAYGWRIVTLNNINLVIKRELSEQEIDHLALMDLYNELFELAYNAPCSNANDWSFTAFGAKACGGAQGYIPYSNSIDTVAFLEKVAAYTTAEKEYNIKWSVVSDCAIINAPTSVSCQNGYPVLNY